MSTLYVDTITEKTLGNGVQIPGHVVQVVHHSFTNTTTTTSNYVDCGGSSFTITPTSTSSKILILMDASFYFEGSTSERPSGAISINYNGSIVDPYNSNIDAMLSINNSYFYGRINRQVYVTAGSTSPVTIKLQIAKYNGALARINGASGSTSYITAMEIAQ